MIFTVSNPLFIYKIAANTCTAAARIEKVFKIIFINTAHRKHRYMTYRSSYGLKVAQPHIGNGKQLNKVSTGIISCHNLRWGQRSRHRDKSQLNCTVYNCRIDIRRNHIFCSGSGSYIHQVRRDHSARSYIHLSNVLFLNLGYRFCGHCPCLRLSLVKGYFNQSESAFIKSICHFEAFVRLNSAHNRNELFFFNFFN